MSEEALSEDLYRRCSAISANRDLLVIQDSTSFNLNTHYFRLKKETGLGPIEDNFHLGFFMHASLVVDKHRGSMIGFSDIAVWHRTYDDPLRAKHTRYLPIEQKETYKWIKAAEHTKQRLKEASSITFVEDRDGDIYEQFARIPDQRTHFVIRVCKQRKLSDNGRLFEKMASLPLSGVYTIDIDENRRGKQKKHKRQARLAVSYGMVSVMRPRETINADVVQTVDLNAVVVEELSYSGKDRISWKLLTTHSVESFEDAMEVIRIYRCRWHIEQLFRLLKKQGFDMEGSQLETGWAIRKLSILALNATLRVMQLMHANEEDENQGIDDVFSSEEQQCLKQLNGSLSGNTAKLSNPFKVRTLLWARWIIARLGGWKGYNSQRRAGPITLKRGVDTFANIFQGWKLAQLHFKDVGTQ